jgi:transcriptional regulator
MYTPQHFASHDEKLTLKIAQEYPFATMVSVDENGEPFINHLPLVVEKADEKIVLLGHMARKNPQWRHFLEGSSVTAVFHGPHTYITPNWYVSGRDVPTWNYAVIHIKGQAELIEDFESLSELLKVQTTHFENGSAQPWKFELPEDLADPRVLTSAIVGFRIRTEQIDAKFKLSQNRSESDQRGVLKGLSTRTDEMSRKVRDLMEGNSVWKSK